MNKKYQKIISKLSKEIILSFSGDNAIRKAKEDFRKYEIIKETDKATLIKVKIFDSIKYGELVSKLLRTKYSADEEMAILRQRDEKPEEFQEYFEFAEQCKTDAKHFITEREEFYK